MKLALDQNSVQYFKVCEIRMLQSIYNGIGPFVVEERERCRLLLHRLFPPLPYACLNHDSVRDGFSVFQHLDFLGLLILCGFLFILDLLLGPVEHLTLGKDSEEGDAEHEETSDDVEHSLPLLTSLLEKKS